MIQNYDPNDLRFIATHEAGHAVSAIVLGIPLERVDIIPRQSENKPLSVGFTKIRPVDVRDIAGRGEKVAMPHLVRHFTGSFAELAVNPLALECGGDAPDREQAELIAKVAICESIVDESGILRVSAEEVGRTEERWSMLLFAARVLAKDLVDANRGKIAAVANALLERKELTGDEVASIVAAADASLRIESGTLSVDTSDASTRRIGSFTP
jgi:hypothetical protein